MSDFMESYELVAFDMPDGSPDVTVAGAVHAGAPGAALLTISLQCPTPALLSCWPSADAFRYRRGANIDA